MKKKHEQDILYVKGAAREIFTQIFLGIFGLTGLILICLVKLDTILLYWGMLSLAVSLFPAIFAYLPGKEIIYAKCNAERITLTNLYNKAIITEAWEDLKCLEIKELKLPQYDGHDGKYIIMSFLLGRILTNRYTDICKMPHVIMIYATKINRKKLKKYLPEEFKSCLG